MSKKLLILVLAFWTCAANFAYASAQEKCADMMQSHACPKAMPCQCTIEAPSNERTVPEAAQVRLEPPQVSALPASAAVVALPDLHAEASVFESPPKTIPLFRLFSVYRL